MSVDAQAMGRAVAKIHEAEAAVKAACEELAQGGMKEAARDLQRLRGQVAVWTQKGGYFDHLAQPTKNEGASAA